MALQRVVYRNLLRSQFRATTQGPNHAKLWQRVARKGYATASHDAKKSSDLPWALASICVTVPTCGYLLMSGPGAGHGHEDHGSHAEEHEEPGEGSEDGEDTESGPQGSGDEEGKDEGKGESEPEASDEENPNGEDTPTSSEGESSEEPDAGKQTKPKDEQAKPKKDQSGAPIHKTNPTEDPSASKKGEGAPETAKSKGTVSTDRSQPEKRQ